MPGRLGLVGSLVVAFRVIPCRFTCAEQGDQVAEPLCRAGSAALLRVWILTGHSQLLDSSAEVNGGESVLQSPASAMGALTFSPVSV